MSVSPFQLEGLHLLGYSQRESEFLFLVATHSGYFTTHQFKNFIRSDSGSLSHAFIRKLLERKHASYRAYRSGERVYHLFARKVYQAIERENLRTRKKHELEYIKTRLVTLDFVLAHPQHRYLETEDAKLLFFERECGLDRAAFPVKLYRARKTAEVTPRYFVDRFPIFIEPSGGRITFTYIDSGAVTLDGFRTHLRAYSGLFQPLPTFDFICVAPTKRLFRAAESEFEHIVSGHRSIGKPVKLLDYFRVRRAWDAKERVASRDVVLLKEAEDRYAGKTFEELYEQWRNGTTSDEAVMGVAQQTNSTIRGTFYTFLGGDSLKVFREPRANSMKGWPNPRSTESASQASSGESIRISGP